MECPEDLRYTREHEWIRVEKGKETRAWIGITDYAQESLGDIVHVDLPSEGDEVQAQEPFGSVESVKAVSDLFSPVTGKVVEINDALMDSPEMVNEDPYGEAWMICVKVSDSSDLKKLMSADQYREFVESTEEEPGE